MATLKGIVSSVLLALMALSCDTPHRNLSLVPAEAASPDEEEDRLRRLQLVRVIDLSDPKNPKKDQEKTAAFLADFLQTYTCQQQANSHANPLLGLDYIDREICIANTLLEMASDRAEPVPLVDSFRPSLKLFIPAQSSATNAALAEEAMRYHAMPALRLALCKARLAVGLAALPIEQVANGVNTPECADAVPETTLKGTIAPNGTFTPAGTTPAPGSITVAALLGQRIAEAYQIFREAAERAATLNVAVADAQRATPSISKKVTRGLSGTALSRIAAAHLLVGGSPGLLASTSDEARPDLCSVASLAPQAAKALAIFRDAGVSPAAILSTKTTKNLLDGGVSAAIPGGSVAQRLSERWGFDFDHPPEGIPVQTSIADFYHLRQDDFATARRYLTQEFAAFSRSNDAQLEPAPVENGKYKRYAATAQPPQALPDAYHAAVASFNVFQPTGEPRFLPSANPVGGKSLSFVNLAQGIDAALTHARLVLSQQATITDASVRADLMTPLAAMLAPGESRGRVELCRTVFGSLKEEIIFKVGGYTQADGLVVVRGEDGLRCAVTGTIEGAPCETSFNKLKLLTLTNNGSTVLGFGSAVGGTLAINQVLNGTRLYVVQKTGKGTTPGAYRALAGVQLENANNDLCFYVPIVPDVMAQAARLIAPSPDWCTEPRVSCGDTDFDARLPLEDELSSDADGVESSWRHYLSLARDAATRADSLGQEYLNSGIERESRLETNEIRDDDRERIAEDKAISAVIEVQDTCGTAIDPIRLLKLLSTGSDGGDLNLIRDATHGAPCATGFQEVLGQCIIDLQQLSLRFAKDPIYPDLVRLDACLSDKDMLPFVHLGSATRPVCLWHDSNNPRKVCSGADATHPCPVLSANRACGNLNVPVTTPPKTPVTVSDSLRLIDTGDLPTFHKDGASPATPLSICDRMRALRTSPNDEYLAAIQQSARFTQLRSTDFIKRIGFEARYGGYSVVQLDSAVRYVTGSPWSGPQTSGWPCKAADVKGCDGAGAPGLFCKSYDCTDPTDRTRANDRLARAVVALAATVTPFRQFTHALDVPALQKFVWPRLLPFGFYDHNEDFQTIQLSGETPRDFFVSATQFVPLSEFTSVKYTNSGFTAPRAYRGAPTENAALAYSYFVNANDAGTHNLSNLAPIPLDQHYGFQSLFPATLDPRRLSNYNYNAEVAPLFYDHLSVDNAFGDGYFACKFRHNYCDGARSVVSATPGDTSFNFNYEPESMLDGLELMCQLGEEASTNCSPPTQINSVADLPATKKYLECIADQIKLSGAHTVLKDFPKSALDPLGREVTTGSDSTLGGGVGADVELLKSALTDLADVPSLITDQLKQLAVAINDVYLSVQNVNLTKDIADVQLESTISNQIASCISAASPTLGSGGGIISWNPGSIAVCANSIAQISFATEINSLQRQQADLNVDFKLNDFDGRFSTLATTMGTYATRLSKAVSDVDAQLLLLEQQRNRAKLSLVKAMYVNSFTSKFEARINALQNARFQTSRVRYERARKTAQRIAFLAKRSIEMRLGLRLADLTDDLPLVEAPANWESKVCTLSGIDYGAIATSGVSEGETTNFADEFIGDYVDRLENVVESYRLVHNFHEGTDVAVLSLRDDVQNSRAVCEVPVGNQLFNAGQLNVATTVNSPGWDFHGCATKLEAGLEVPLPSCIGILEEQGKSPGFGVPDLATASPYTLKFADGANCAPTSCGYRAGAFLGQDLNVDAGLYRISVYVKEPALYSDIGLRIALDGKELPAFSMQTDPAPFSWPRLYASFEVPRAAKLSFRFTRPTLASTQGANDITLAAPMLERLAFPTAEVGVAPASFANTSSVRTRPLPLCEDRDGQVFRNNAWKRGNALLCENGFTGKCDGGTAKAYGYWETSFNLSQRAIEDGTILGSSGFARGNFNYRIESLALNFVGTGIKDCGSVNLPSTCYSAGYVPYTLVHNGPYYVRNHLGADFEAQLFTGRIEHARGLATERYITSPLSKDDRDLLSDFTKTELQGRPLDGNFVLRVWDAPGTNFNSIEDVQVLLKYRYWTRFN